MSVISYSLPFLAGAANATSNVLNRKAACEEPVSPQGKPAAPIDKIGAQRRIHCTFNCSEPERNLPYRPVPAEPGLAHDSKFGVGTNALMY